MVQLDPVEPGDLITADFMNGILAELADLRKKVAELNGETGPTPTGPPTLSRREPLGDLRIGGLLTLIGTGFAPLDKTVVHLGNVTIDQFTPDSTDTRLAFPIPAQFPALPLDTAVRVENDPRGESGPLAVRLLEGAVGPGGGGTVVVKENNQALPKIQAGQSYPLKWSITSKTNQAVTYDLGLVFTGVDPSNLLDQWKEAALSTTQVKLAPGGAVEVTARVSVPTGAKSASIALRAESTDGSIANTSGATTLKVGATPDVSDPGVTLVLDSQPPFDPATGDPNPVANSAGTVKVEFGATGVIRVKAIPTESGRYEFSSAIESPDTSWAKDTIDPAAIEVSAAAPPVVVMYGIKNLGSAGAPPADTFFVARATRKDNNGVEHVSFTRFPIKGAKVI